MIDAALEYARTHVLHALLVARNGALEIEEYGDGFHAKKAHALYSGTKSFWGVAAALAEREGLLRLDEPVALTFRAWENDDWKRVVTLRMLLDLTAGFGFGGLGAAVPTYEAALATPLRNEPGARFVYGGIAFQVFGAVLARKLETIRSSPLEFLRQRILDEAGVAIASWRLLPDGTYTLPTGAQLTASDWLAYGTWILHHRSMLPDCFKGSTANPRYGLGWWLGARAAPGDVFYASGSGGQALYLVPSQSLAIVHFGKSGSYRHETFLKRFFSQ